MAANESTLAATPGGGMTMPRGYVIHHRAGVCWIMSEPAHISLMWSHPDPLAAVVVMIARAVDMTGNDITAKVAVAIREALTTLAMAGEANLGGD